MARRKFTAGNKFSQALKATKGRSCNRKAVLQAVARGASPAEAANRHCGAGRTGGSRRKSRG